jgi:hypothetical protein
MGRVTHEDLKVFWLEACEDIEAPTSAEITAGTELTDQIPVDGVAVNPTGNNASQPMLGDAFVAEKVGTWGRGITLTFTRDDTSDVARTLFTYRQAGFLLLARFGAPESGDDVEVYPAESHEPADLASAENEFSKFEVQLAVTDTPALRAVVDASS